MQASPTAAPLDEGRERLCRLFAALDVACALLRSRGRACELHSIAAFVREMTMADLVCSVPACSCVP